MGIGRRTLDLTRLGLQPGFASTATGSEDPGFDACHVVSLTIHLGSSGAVDDLSWFLPAKKARRGAPARLRARIALPAPDPAQY